VRPKREKVEQTEIIAEPLNEKSIRALHNFLEYQVTSHNHIERNRPLVQGNFDFLPQVSRWALQRFLTELCLRAGLYWRAPSGLNSAGSHCCLKQHLY